MTKSELRQKYKYLRQELSEEETDVKSLAIANNTLKLPIWQKEFFHIFLPIAHHREIDTNLILHILQGKDKQIVVSRSDFETREMTHYLLEEETRLVVNEYGIPEPVESAKRVDVSKIDVVFVPLLAFDQKGNRVGYGKGFYDKFLSECRIDVIKVGLSFFETEEEIGDVYEGDVRLDYCVTPEGIRKFENEIMP